MLVARVALVTHEAAELAKRRVLRHVDTEGQSVVEEADQPLELRAIPVRDGRAHHELALPRQTPEEHGEPGKQDHE